MASCTDRDYTPGPWKTHGNAVLQSNFGDWQCRVRADDCGPVTVAKVSAGNGPNNTAEVARANAMLIAAAPELLAALVGAVAEKDAELAAFKKNLGRHPLVMPEWLEQARAVIKKATNGC